MKERMFLCTDEEETGRAWSNGAEEDGRTGRQRCEGWDSWRGMRCKLFDWLVPRDEGFYDKAGQNAVWGIWWLFEESAGSRWANSNKGELTVCVRQKKHGGGGTDHKDEYGLEKTGCCQPSDRESVSHPKLWYRYSFFFLYNEMCQEDQALEKLDFFFYYSRGRRINILNKKTLTM